MTPRLAYVLCISSIVALGGEAIAQSAEQTAAPTDIRKTMPPPIYLPERYEPRGGGASFLGIAVPDFDRTDIPGGNRRPVMGFRLLGNISRSAYTPVTHEGISIDSVAWRYVTEPVIDIRLVTGTVIAGGLPLVLQRGRVEPAARIHEGDSAGDGWIEATHAWQAGGGYVGGTIRLTAPTGNEDLAIGNGALRMLSELIAGRTFDRRWQLAGSIGYRKAFPARSDRSAGDEIVYRLGARLHTHRRLLHIETAFVGAVGVDGPVDDRVDTAHLPAEWLMGVRWPVFSQAAAVRLGIGIGLDRGEGMPLGRFLVGIDVACAIGDCLRIGGPMPDADGDGIPDIDDDCPQWPEDIDGFEDDDGCIDHDNDGDSIVDADDQCDDLPEDRDGFQDDDGCPDIDNDNDGVPDEKDNCPRDPEDHDNYQDTDGCPDPDDDSDGIPDAFDMCHRPDSPGMQQIHERFAESVGQHTQEKQRALWGKLKNSKEDVDGFEDEDGCPDYDHDGDGIPEWDDKCPEVAGRQKDGCPYPDGDDLDTDGIARLVDRCPGRPEDRNGFVDGDGCPDVFIDWDLRPWFTVDDLGRIVLAVPLDADPTPSLRAKREARTPAWIDAEGDHRARLAGHLERMLIRLNENAIHLELRAADDSSAIVDAFVAAIDHKDVKGQLLPQCGRPQKSGEPVIFSLCRAYDPETAGRRLRTGLPQNLPACPKADELEEYRCGR